MRAMGVDNRWTCVLRWLIPLSIAILSTYMLRKPDSMLRTLVLEPDLSYLLMHPWSLLSYAWIHYSSAHLLMNTLVLLGITVLWRGHSVKMYFTTFVAATIVCGMAFCIGSTSHSAAWLCGASSGIAGLLGYHLCRVATSLKGSAIRHRDLLVMLVLGSIIGGDIVSGSIMTAGLWYIHLLGYLTGIFLALVWKGVSVHKHRKQEEHAATLRRSLLSKVEQSGYHSLTEVEKEQMQHRYSPTTFTASQIQQ